VTDAPGRLVVEALRLDRWDAGEVDRRLDRALDLGVGGFVLFGGEAEEVAHLTTRARRDAGRPLWIGADLERGAGQQFRGLTELPPPAALAAAALPGEAAERAGRVTGREARSVGVDWVLAPVVDLDVEPRNPIVSTRSFGADPVRVTALALRWVAGCQATGALACAKHFPGHGRTVADSHVELPLVESSPAELEDDLRPFAALAPRVATMMVAHVAYPGLGSGRPATLDPAIVGGLLRDRLGFRGPVATDAMIMGGIGEDDAAAAVEAVRAGCDLVLYPSDAAATVAALRRAAASDVGFSDRVGEALATSARALAALASPPPADAAPAVPRPTEGFDEVAFALDTIVDRSGGLEAWRPDAPTVVIAVSDDPEVGPPAGRAGPLGAPLRAALRAGGWNVAPAEPAAPESRPGARTGSGRPVNASQVIAVLAATPRGWKGHGGVSSGAAEAVRDALAGAGRGLLVLLGPARALESLSVPGIAAWSTETVMERAAAEWIQRHAGGST